MRIKAVKSICIVIALLIVTAAVSCGAEQGEDNAVKTARFEENFIGPFDTVTTLVCYTASQEEFDKLVSLVRNDLEQYHALFDFFESHPGINNIKTINDQAGKKPVKVDPVIMDFLEQCLWANEISAGRVNVALGSVLSIWHKLRTEGLDNPAEARLPTMTELEEANKHSDINKLEINRQAGTVFLPDPKMSLDVGSGAKGFACELVVEHAQEEGFESFVISLGGNVRTVGVKSDSGQKWRIGVKNPDVDAQQKILDVLEVSDLAIVTSGVYERYYTVNGERYHHIIDPDTLMPSQYFDSVTLIAPSSALADALTTALLNMSYEKGRALLRELDNCEALWINDGHRYTTPGYDELVTGE
ncbi:MAG TPA: FAD:protein FMN transferase [Clostridiaceae bacterium]|nr:FAD:protein FMN transferase [Clostridiaceae bacterium]